MTNIREHFVHFIFNSNNFDNIRKTNNKTNNTVNFEVNFKYSE